MNENLHKDDEYFKNAYERFEDEPSPEVWDKISSALDRQDVGYYRQKFTVWKRIACLLLLLLGSLFMYETFFADKQKDVANIIVHNDSAAALADAESGSNKIGEKNKNSQPSATADNETASTKKEPAADSDIGNNNRNDYNDNLRKKNSTAKQNERFVQQQSNDADSSLQAKQLLSINSDNRFTKKPDFYSQTDSNRIVVNTKDSAAGKQIAALQSSPATAQSDSTQISKVIKKIKKRKTDKPYWSFTPYASADLTHYKLDDDDVINNGGGPVNKQEIEEQENHEFSFSAGVLARRQITKSIAFKTGIVYSDIAIGIRPQTLYATPDNNRHIEYKIFTSSGYAYVKPLAGSTPAAGDSINCNIAQHHLHYVYAPVIINYTIVAGKRISISPGAGINANFLLGTKLETELNNAVNKEHVVINKLQGLRPFYFSFISDADVQFKMNEQVKFTLLPMFKYAIDPINKNNVVKTYPYSFGLGAGITYSF